MSENTKEIIDKLSPIERKVLPFIDLPYKEMIEKSNLDSTSVLRALKFLEAKKILKLKVSKSKIIDLGTNGIYYKKHGLPERKILSLLEKSNNLEIEEAKKNSALSDNEFRVSLGVLKNKALIDLKNGKLFLSAKKEELTKKSLEEVFLDNLPLVEAKMSDEQKYAFSNLLKRKEIIEIREESSVEAELTDFGRKIKNEKIKEEDLIEELTPEVIKNWKKNKEFRKYDLNSNAPKIYGGRKHFVNDIIEETRKIWIELGFKEMDGPKVDSSFWIFDSLFTPQDHPAREMQDTFFLKDMEGEISDSSLLNSVRKAHETGVSKGKGWNYTWDQEIAQKMVLRTHTTGLSARKIHELKDENQKGKYFAIGRVFRNETIDSSHLFEFNQTEGIIMDENANFQSLLGYLKIFLEKMGFKKIRFRPHFFPYTEPSVEADIFNDEKNKWVEILGAGILRPEVVIPLYGKFIPVLAWGLGLDRLIKEKFHIKDIREIYTNDLGFLRKREVLK